MKTVNRGPQILFFLDHKIIHRASLINTTFLLLPNSWQLFPHYSSPELPDPTSPPQTHTLHPSHAKTKQRAILNICSPFKQKHGEHVQNEILEWAWPTAANNGNPLRKRRKLHWVLVEDVSILRRRGRGALRGGLQRKWDKLPILDFGTLLWANTTNFYWICVFVWELQTCSWTIKTEDDPFI